VGVVDVRELAAGLETDIESAADILVFSEIGTVGDDVPAAGTAAEVERLTRK